MGGYGSGGHNRKWATAEMCARIDAGMIRRAGMFDAHTPRKSWGWPYENSRSRHTVTVMGMSASLHTGAIALGILPAGDKGNGYWCDVKTSTTPCTYGHTRTWLHCPQCQRRVFRLYYCDSLYNRGEQLHALMCRHCLGATYVQRRERGHSRLQTSIMRITSKLVARGAPKPDDWETPPDKPKGMHWRTYSRLARRFMALHARYDAAWVGAIQKYLDA